ncbi:MAG: hypothetical protein AAF484_09550 [Pseudomonadota bacterium]
MGIPLPPPSGGGFFWGDLVRDKGNRITEDRRIVHAEGTRSCGVRKLSSPGDISVDHRSTQILLVPDVVVDAGRLDPKCKEQGE